MPEPHLEKMTKSVKYSLDGIHLEIVEGYRDPHARSLSPGVFLTQEDDEGMIPMESFYALPLWVIAKIADWYERNKPPFPGDTNA
jgi:hypothetical protein